MSLRSWGPGSRVCGPVPTRGPRRTRCCRRPNVIAVYAAQISLSDIMSAKSKRHRRQMQEGGSATWAGRFWPLILLVVVIVFFSAIRFRLRNMPLERDEGEYAYAGQLILQGIAPYELAYNMKLPGTYAAYALIMAIFGQSDAGIHLGMILVNGATSVLIFLIARKLFDDIAAVAAASIYALLSTSESVLGFAGHANHFVVLAAVAGILALFEALGGGRILLFFLSGSFFGLAFVFKQPGLFFGLFGSVYLIASERKNLKTWTGAARLTTFGAGLIFPFALTCLLMLAVGNLGKMWFWTYSYARQYGSVTVLWEGWDYLFEIGFSVVEKCLLAWILAALGLAALAWDSRLRKHAWFLIAFLLFSWAAVCVGFYFRQHYFILVLPAVSLFAGVAITSAARELSQVLSRAAATAIPVLILAIVVVVSVAAQSDVMFQLDPISVCRKAYGVSPFPEAEVISRFLNQRTQAEARIAVLGSEPEIYFDAHRHSATGYIYVYPLFEPQKFALQMQKEMAKEIEENRPDYIVLVKVVTSWQVRPGAERWILTWFKDYLAAHYQIVGVADEVAPQTRYIWGDAAKAYKEESGAAIEVFKRSGLPASSSSSVLPDRPSKSLVFSRAGTAAKKGRSVIGLPVSLKEASYREK